MTPLDVLVAQAVSGARALERAVHDPGPWSVLWGGVEVPAERALHDSSVSFVAVLPAGPAAVAELRCRGEGLLWQELDGSAEGFELEWELALPSLLAA